MRGKQRLLVRSSFVPDDQLVYVAVVCTFVHAAQLTLCLFFSLSCRPLGACLSYAVPTDFNKRCGRWAGILKTVEHAWQTAQLCAVLLFAHCVFVVNTTGWRFWAGVVHCARYAVDCVVRCVSTAHLLVSHISRSSTVRACAA